MRVRPSLCKKEAECFADSTGGGGHPEEVLVIAFLARFSAASFPRLKFIALLQEGHLLVSDILPVLIWK